VLTQCGVPLVLGREGALLLAAWVGYEESAECDCERTTVELPEHLAMIECLCAALLGTSVCVAMDLAWVIATNPGKWRGVRVLLMDLLVGAILGGSLSAWYWFAGATWAYTAASMIISTAGATLFLAYVNLVCGSRFAEALGRNLKRSWKWGTASVLGLLWVGVIITMCYIYFAIQRV